MAKGTATALNPGMVERHLNDSCTVVDVVRLRQHRLHLRLPRTI